MESVVSCFTELAKIDSALGDFAKRNVAFEVVKLLGWKSKPNFDADLLSLHH